MVMLFRIGNSVKSPCSFLSSGTSEILFLIASEGLLKEVFSELKYATEREFESIGRKKDWKRKN